MADRLFELSSQIYKDLINRSHSIDFSNVADNAELSIKLAAAFLKKYKELKPKSTLLSE